VTLSALARSLFWALLALIVFGIVLVFVQIPGGAPHLRSRRPRDLRRSDAVSISSDCATPRTSARRRFLAASIFLDVLNVFSPVPVVFSAATSNTARVMTSAFHGCDEFPSNEESVRVHLARSQLNPFHQPRRS